MTSIAEKALLLRIESGNSKLDELIDMVLRIQDVSATVLDALDQRISIALDTEYIGWATVIPYLRKFSRHSIYSSIYQKNKPTGFDLAELFKMGYGGREVEEKLGRDLYEAFHSKGTRLYGHIFEALSEHGGPESLELLEILRFELDPILKTHQIVADSIKAGIAEKESLNSDEALQLIDLMWMKDFSKQTESSILLMKLRGVKPTQEPVEEDSEGHESRSRRHERTEHYFNKAKRLLPDHPPEALNNMRKAAEAICKDILDSLFENSKDGKSKPAKAFNSLEDMLSMLRRENQIPIHIEKCFSSLQSFGNLASHDQDLDPESITNEMAEPVLAHLQAVITWYETLKLWPDPRETGQ